jgi:hypothetical protein
MLAAAPVGMVTSLLPDRLGNLSNMAYTSEEARTQILSDLAAAIEQLAFAIANLSEAYEILDDDTADVLEQGMFRPVQLAYGRSKRTYSTFAVRHGLPDRIFEETPPGMHSNDPKVYIQRAVDAIEAADHRIAELQDSMLPVDVGDPELRAGLSETRASIAEGPGRGRQLLRTFGR